MNHGYSVWNRLDSSFEPIFTHSVWACMVARKLLYVLYGSKFNPFGFLGVFYILHEVNFKMTQSTVLLNSRGTLRMTVCTFLDEFY